MKRFALALDLKPDPALIGAYREHHRNVAPVILASIRDAGILRMDIYSWGNRLFMIMETTAAFDFGEKAAADAANPAVQTWEKLMDTYQQGLPGALPGSKWQLMDLIFSL